MISHGTINLYTAALLSFLRKIKIEFLDENKNLITKNIPIMYSSKEKAKSLEFFKQEDFISGNVNLLPRGTLSLVTIIKREDALLNRNIKINKVKNIDGSFEYAYNSVPFSFIYEFNIFCRGMSELTSLIEIIMPRFNPNLALDVYDVANLDEPSRIPLKLMDVAFEEVDGFSETSKNIWNATFSMQIDGNLYQNIKTTNPLTEYKEAVNKARAAYDKLTVDQKALVENYDVLVKAMKTIDDLKKQAKDDPNGPTNPGQPNNPGQSSSQGNGSTRSSS